jgi:hypothetical protein
MSGIWVIPEPGKFIVIGRADEMLNIGGIKRAPRPLEARALTIDGVTDAVLSIVTRSYLMNGLHVLSNGHTRPRTSGSRLLSPYWRRVPRTSACTTRVGFHVPPPTTSSETCRATDFRGSHHFRSSAQR